MSRNTASDSVALTKAITIFNTKASAFAKATEAATEAMDVIKSFGAEKVAEYETQISAKRKEFDAATQDLEHQSKKRKLESDLKFEKDEYEAAKEVLTNHKEVPVKSVDLKALGDEVEKLRKSNQAELDVLKAQCKKDEANAVKAATTNQNLVHKAEIAELSAASKQKDGEIAALKNQISQQQNEIKSQRELTAKVAESGRSGAISQSFGKQ